MIAFDFMQDFAVVVLLAAGIAWVCQRARIPVVLGYLTVGILVGPHTPSLPLITNAERIHTLAQLGLAFLMFSIGQGLRLQRLKRTGLPLVLATLIIAILILNTCRLFGNALGWPANQSLVLAGLLMVSSTAIIGKSLRETHALHSSHGQTTLTITALDDLVAMVMLTVLTSLAQAGGGESVTVLGTVVKLQAVMITLIIVALLTVPVLLRTAARCLLPEVQTLFVVGLLLGMALLSAKAGFSAALGAFLLGTIVTNTGLSAQVERACSGLCDVFGAVFFVAMGMLFDFALLLQVWPLALGVFVLAVVTRVFAATLALVTVGHAAGEALKSGVSLTAIGEFSLIIALVAVEGGLASESFYAVAVALCFLTAATTPFLIRIAPAWGDWLERRQPERTRLWIGLYHNWIEQLHRRQRSRHMWKLIGPRVVQIAMQVLLISGLLLLVAPFCGLVQRWLGRDWPIPNGLPVLFWFGFGLVLLAPLVALWRQIEAIAMMCAEVATPHRSRLASMRPLFKVLFQTAVAGTTLLWLITLLPLDSFSGWGALVLVALLASATVVLWRRLIRWHSRLESDLRVQLADTPFARLPAAVGQSQGLRTWEFQASDIVVRAGTRAVGLRIEHLPLRHRFRCTVMALERQGVTLPNPPADTMVFPGDTFLLVGREDNLREAEQWLNEQQATEIPRQETCDLNTLSLMPLSVPLVSRHIGKPLSELELGTQWGVQVVGIKRDGMTMVSPGRNDTLQPGDHLLVLGASDRVKELAFWFST